MEVDIEDKITYSTFNMNFVKIFENLENIDNNSSSNIQTYNFSPPKKKNSLELSDFIEQTFCENSNINIEEEFHNEETYLKIGNEGQYPCIDPILEVDSFDRENESFLHENNYLINNLNEVTNSFDFNSSVGISPSELIRTDSTMEDTEIHKIRKNFLGIKLSKTNLSQNKTEINLQTSRRPLFFTTNSEVLNKTVVTPLRTNNNPKLNQSCSLSFNFQQQKKRGRKKFLFDGIKTEVIDKAFLREFKSYIKKSKVVFKTIYDELKQEEKIFWNEFLQNTNPPFVFTQNRVKVEYKSFNRQLLKFIFSHLSVRKIYSLFIKEKEKDLMGSILNKKVKKIDRKMLLIYSFYGKNLHKLYSDEYNIHDINFEEIEGIGLSNFSDSLVINTSI